MDNESPAPDLGESPSVLVVRFSSIGDVLLTTPVLRALRGKWPRGRISFLTRERFAPLVEGNPNLDEIITLGGREDLTALIRLARSLNSRDWDLLADLHCSLRSSLLRKLLRPRHTVCYSKLRIKRSLLIYTRFDRYGPRILSVPERYALALAPFGIRLDEAPGEIFLNAADRQPLEEHLATRWPGPRPPLMALAPGAAWPVKRWPAERFAAAALDLCRRYGFKAILLGGAADRETCARVAGTLGQADCLDLSGKLRLRSSAAAVAAARILLTNDTGLMHIATAVGTPVVAVFGPTTRHFGYFPYRGPARVVETKLYCRPCTHNGRGRCPLLHFRCMKDIPPERVVQATEELLTIIQ